MMALSDGKPVKGIVYLKIKELKRSTMCCQEYFLMKTYSDQKCVLKLKLSLVDLVWLKLND